MDEKISRKHVVTLTDRHKLTLTGVTDVFSFDEEAVELETIEGYIEIKGEDLHIIKMNIDDGEMIIEGLIAELIYHETQTSNKKKSSIMSKLFK
ncbi:sporulation protein YabP [Sporanaerobium hydrogeniformans]|uniref:Sporulation protein YabP n=1 Tax=Sporanaerobium hydrogeniformans TaxID=3072179 RepID=A0AC61DAT5_9FIRM|nr:sporulation protein YabP [Sporanaerobium hydrogeniformans]PHV70366.1 sporulation protein YabP [Sporanaerobium hydrogeniformans]